MTKKKKQSWMMLMAAAGIGGWIIWKKKSDKAQSDVAEAVAKTGELQSAQAQEGYITVGKYY